MCNIINGDHDINFHETEDSSIFVVADEEHEEIVCVSCNNINAGHPQFFLCLHTEPNLASISEIKASGPGSRSDQIASIVSFSDH